VTLDAALIGEHLISVVLGGPLDGQRRRRLLLCDPCIELGRLDGQGSGSHQRMRQATELGAMTPELTGLVGLEPQLGYLTRHEIAFSMESGNPEVVKNVI